MLRVNTSFLAGMMVVNNVRLPPPVRIAKQKNAKSKEKLGKAVFVSLKKKDEQLPKLWFRARESEQIQTQSSTLFESAHTRA